MSDVNVDRSLLGTIELLEHRLQKIEFILGGTDDPRDFLEQTGLQGRAHTVPARLGHLETTLGKLSANSKIIRNIVHLHLTYPEVFLPESTSNDQSTFSEVERLSIVDSYATLYATTASQLTSVQDVPIPPAEASASLISLHPRLARVEDLQHSQSREVAELRLRTASLLQRWYKSTVLDSGECWTEWENRVTAMEKGVRRREAAILRSNTAL